MSRTNDNSSVSNDSCSLEDIAVMRESVDLECKLAQGRDGKGRLPKDMWEAYSAFANTSGGDIFLGLREKNDQSFELKGVENTQKVLDELWAILNNTQKVSSNLIRERCVKVLEIDGKNLIQIHVPPAITKSYTLCSTMDEVEPFKKEIAFLCAVKNAIIKLTIIDKRRTDEEKNSSLKQIIDNAIIADEAIDLCLKQAEALSQSWSSL